MESMRPTSTAKRKVMHQLLDEEAVKKQKHLSIVTLGEKEDTEKMLEDLVFGAEEELLDKLTSEHGDDIKGTLLKDDSSDEDVESEAQLQVQSQRKPVWNDEDDEVDEKVDMTHRNRRDLVKCAAEKKFSKQKLQQRLQEQFNKTMGGTPLWAEKPVKKNKKKTNDDDDDDDEDVLLCKTGNFVASSDSLPKGIIQIKSCLHANKQRVCEGRLSTVQFHPSAQVVMTAGIDRSISLFQVDGMTNPKIQSIFLDKFPVYKARFSADGEQVVATSIHNKIFYIYDMMEGKVMPVYTVKGLDEKKVKEFEVSPDGMFMLLLGRSGYLHLLTMKTKELVRSMKMNGEVEGAVFSTDGEKIYSCSDEGEVYIWDVKSGKCLNKMTDEGSLRGTSIAISRNGQYLACGSSSGVVNVYQHDTCLQESNPKPVKAIMNLVTPVNLLRFNPSTEILAMASRAMEDSIRMVHIPSFTVFSNYPILRRKTIYYPQCLDFSPNSGFFSVANNKGSALLYRLPHYTDF